MRFSIGVISEAQRRDVVTFWPKFEDLLSTAFSTRRRSRESRDLGEYLVREVSLINLFVVRRISWHEDCYLAKVAACCNKAGWSMDSQSPGAGPNVLMEEPM